MDLCSGECHTLIGPSVLIGRYKETEGEVGEVKSGLVWSGRKGLHKTVESRKLALLPACPPASYPPQTSI